MNHTSQKNYGKDIEGLDMEPYKTFFVTFDCTKLNINNINGRVKNIASSSDKRGKAKEKVVAQIYGKIDLPKRIYQDTKGNQWNFFY